MLLVHLVHLVVILPVDELLLLDGVELLYPKLFLGCKGHSCLAVGLLHRKKSARRRFPFL